MNYLLTFVEHNGQGAKWRSQPMRRCKNAATQGGPRVGLTRIAIRTLSVHSQRGGTEPQFPRRHPGKPYTNWITDILAQPADGIWS